MGFLESIGFRKKKAQRTRQVTRQQTRQPTRKVVQADKPDMSTKAREDPLITVSRQLTQIQEELTNINTTVHSGFKGLRDDHHKILDEQASKKDLEGYLTGLEAKKTSLEKTRDEIDKTIELLDVDHKILSLLKDEEAQSVTVSTRLSITRQYAATRLAALERAALIESHKKGRKRFYLVPKEISVPN